MKDKQGREYARLSQLKAGSQVELDGGFTCIEAEERRIVHHASDGLWIECSEGRHYLQGQLDEADDDSLVGVYEVKP